VHRYAAHWPLATFFHTFGVGRVCLVWFWLRVPRFIWSAAGWVARPFGGGIRAPPGRATFFHTFGVGLRVSRLVLAACAAQATFFHPLGIGAARLFRCWAACLFGVVDTQLGKPTLSRRPG
jgi:hypothetical protein